MAVPHASYVAAYEELHTLDDVQRLSEAGGLGLSYDALQCILSQKLLQLSKQHMHEHRRRAQQYVRRYQATPGETLIEIAASVRISPTQLARLVLEELGAKKGREAGQLLKDVRRIEDARLRAQVAAAVEADRHNGPYVDSVKRLIGLEYEAILNQKLAARRFPFLTEGDLRQRGDAKTPDALLTVPLLVRGRVVNWIDSKATFGDPDSHAAYHADQYRRRPPPNAAAGSSRAATAARGTTFSRSAAPAAPAAHGSPAADHSPTLAPSGYLNRFDTGLVIYWFGYDSSIDEDPRLLILSDFPDADCEVMTVCGM